MIDPYPQVKELCLFLYIGIFPAVVGFIFPLYGKPWSLKGKRQGCGPPEESRPVAWSGRAAPQRSRGAVVTVATVRGREKIQGQSEPERRPQTERVSISFPSFPT